MFDEALTDNSEPAVAYLIGATRSCKRLLGDGIARLDFEEHQAVLLKRLLPPTAEAYFQAMSVLTELHNALDLAISTRYFTAKDNGLTIPNI